MKWTAKNAAGYLKDPSSVDSIIISLVPIEFGQDMIPAVREGEYIEKVTSELERQLTGRLIQSPSFTYFNSENKEILLERLLNWQKLFIEKGAKHCFFITSDVEWKEKESSLDVLIWEPSLPMEHLDKAQQDVMIDETVQTIIKKFQSKWVKVTNN